MVLRAVTAVLLVTAVTWERLAIGQPLGPENLAVWLSGLAVAACVVTGRWFGLAARAGCAAGVSWLTTIGVIIFGPVERSWGPGVLTLCVAAAFTYIPGSWT